MTSSQWTIPGFMRNNSGGGRSQKVMLLDIPETPPPDSWGQPSLAPTVIGTFRARIRQIKGDQTILADVQVYPTRTYIVEMDWLGSAIPATADNSYVDPITGLMAGLILPQMVIQTVMDNKFLHVQEAENVDQLNRMWKLICIEKVGAIA